MQLCAVRSCGFFGNARCLQVLWRADDCHPHFRRDADRDHVPGDLIAVANADVVPVCHDIREAVVGDDLYLEVGILAKDLRQPGPQDCLSRVIGRGDADRTRGFVAKLGDGAQFGIDLFEAGSDGPDSRSPASVGATLRVVRVRSRMPSRVSSARMVWLRPIAIRPVAQPHA